jgi:site-specific DNA recombinase
MKESQPPAPVRTAIYCRISKDRSGESLGVERQEQDCRQLAERLGWEVVGVYIDNDISASTKSRKHRPQYAEMLRLVRGGAVDAILAYSNSRLTRRPAEWIDLISLANVGQLRIKTVASGEHDLSTADGRATALTVAAWDAAEAERTAERVSRHKVQAAAEGKYRGGPRPYGYEKDGVTLNESEARIVRNLCRQLLEGRSMRALVRELNSTGKRTSTGKEWTLTSLRVMLCRPRNAGLISKGRPGSIEVIGPAQWPALVDEDTWRAVYTILTDASRKTHKDTVSRWIGSSAYRCAVCGSTVAISSMKGAGVRAENRKFFYRCSGDGHVTAMAVPTDDFIRRTVAELIRDPRVVATMTEVRDDGLGADRERRAVLAANLIRFEADYAEGTITGQQLQKATQRVEVELVEVDERLAKGMQRSVSSPIALAADPVQAFLGASIDVQRAVMLSLMQVEILPQPKEKRGAAWTPERLRITPVAALDDLDLTISA